MSVLSKAVFSSNDVVVGISEIYSDDAIATANNGETIDIVGADCVVSVGFVRSVIAGEVKFSEAVAVSSLDATGGDGGQRG